MSSNWKQLLCEKHVSPPGLEPGSLKYMYRSIGLTTKLRRHMMKKHAFHIKVPIDELTSIPYTPLPGSFLILHLIKAANKLYINIGNASLG